ncbi:MAG: tetratricopeptide repeat protein [Spirochaetales bacterium]|nr:tetratricopeptide repeat protein [Spirochaetales bacterium]
MKRFTVAIILLAVVLSSCKTTDVEIPEGMTPGEFFVEAQKASSEFNNYDKAIVYYETFISRYPDEPLLIVEAEYEIAFLHYKKGEDEVALQLFNELLEKYKLPEAQIFPAWPEVLAKKIIDKIENGDKPEEPPAADKDIAADDNNPTAEE